MNKSYKTTFRHIFGEFNKLFANYSVTHWLILDPSSILYEGNQTREKILQRIAMNKVRFCGLFVIIAPFLSIF